MLCQFHNLTVENKKVSLSSRRAWLSSVAEGTVPARSGPSALRKMTGPGTWTLWMCRAGSSSSSLENTPACLKIKLISNILLRTQDRNRKNVFCSTSLPLAITRWVRSIEHFVRKRDRPGVPPSLAAWLLSRSRQKHQIKNLS